jgi:hypothetical protein
MKKKKVISILLVLACIFSSFSLLTLGASAEGERVVYATTRSATVQQGSYTYLDVYLDDLTDLSALNVSIYYDPEKVTIKNTYNSVSATVYDITTTEGCVNASYILDGKGGAKKTKLFYFYFQVNSTAEVGDTYFDIVVTEAIDTSLNDIPFSGSRCSFEVKEKPISKTCSITSTSTVSTSVGEEFELSYRLGTYSIASGTVAINYDPELFEVVSVTNGAFLTGKIADVNTELDGAIYLSFIGTAYQYKYDLVTVRFKTLKNVTETSDIKLTVSEFCDLELIPYTCSGYTSKVNIAFDETYTEDAPSMSVNATYSKDTGKVTAVISLEKDSMLGAGDFVLNFDPDVLTYDSLQKGFAPDFFTVNDAKVSEGILKFSIISTKDITDELTVLTVTFDAEQAQEDKATDIAISGSMLTDSLVDTIVLNFVDGSVTIPKIETFTVSGNITSSASETAPITVELIPEGQSDAAYTQTVVGNNASYSFADVAVGTYTLRISKANHLVYQDSVTVIDADVTKDTSLLLGNNGKQFKINSAYLVLSQDINVIYRTTLPDGFVNPRMVFEFNDEQFIITDYTVDDQGRLCYAFPNVNPQKMGDNISATLYATIDGVEASVSVPNYSVRQYCINQLNKNPDENLKRMISDLLVYGEKTQLYQKYKTDALVTDGLTLTPSTFVELDASHNKQQIIGTSDPNVRYSSAKLELSNDMIVLLGITTDDPTPYTFEVTTNGKTVVYTAEDLSYQDGRYYLSFSGVKATRFGDVITAVVKKDGAQISQTLQYSVNTYIQKNQNTDNEVLADLLKAIYNYGESAKLYES